jgi:chaperonin cofactor prefoldin
MFGRIFGKFFAKVGSEEPLKYDVDSVSDRIEKKIDMIGDRIDRLQTQIRLTHEELDKRIGNVDNSNLPLPLRVKKLVDEYNALKAQRTV